MWWCRLIDRLKWRGDEMQENVILHMDWLDGLKTLPDQCVHTCVTSPPYWGLRDYGVTGQLGLEKTPEEYTEKLVVGFREVRRVLRDDGTLWLNLGDCYANDGKWGGETGGKQAYLTDNDRKRVGREKRKTGLKPKDLVGIPWRVAFALQADGWYLRSDIIWSKPNPMPESVTDRPTKAHEYIFLFSKSANYYYDYESIKEPLATSSIGRLSQNIESQTGLPRAHAGGKTNGNMKAVYAKSGNKDRKLGEDRDRPGSHLGSSVPWEGCARNKRTVWTVATKPFSEAHFATFPPDLVKPCILAGAPENGIVLDPFMGAGTTGLVAFELGRKYIGFELNQEYIDIAERRIAESKRRKESLGIPLFG